METELFFGRGIELTNTQEHEIKGKNLKVICAKKSGGFETYTGITEVHYWFNKGRNDEPMVAFESDIHSCGMVRQIGIFSKIVIVESAFTIDEIKRLEFRQDI